MTGSALRSSAVLALALAGCGRPAPNAPRAAVPEAATRVALCVAFRVTHAGPVCIGPLTEEQARRRWLYSHLEYTGDRVTRILRKTGRGGLRGDDDGNVEYRYRYEAGRCAESSSHNRSGAVTERSVYRDAQTRCLLVDEWGRPHLSDDQEAVTELIERDARGFARSIRFLGYDGRPARGAAGAHEVRFERGADGLETQRCYFDAERRPMRARGIHCVVFERDALFTVREETYLDEQGQPAAHFDGTHRIVNDADAWGNVTRSRFIGLDGRAIPSVPAHCSTVVLKLDQTGFETGRDCLDEHDRPGRWREGNSFTRSAPDAQGRVVATRFYDTRGEPTETSGGYFRVEYELDVDGWAVTRRYFFAGGRPGQQRGPAVIRSTRREDGMLAREDYFDAEDRPIPHRGCFRRTWEYDEHRDVTSATCRDASGDSMPDDDGVSVTRYTRDDLGLVVEESYFDPEERAVNSTRGFSRIRQEYDARKLHVRSAFFDAAGARVERMRLRGVFVRPPFTEAGWTWGDRSEALARITRARESLLAGMAFEEAALRYGDSRVSLIASADDWYSDPKELYVTARAAVERLRPGEYSEISEIPGGFWVYQRLE